MKWFLAALTILLILLLIFTGESAIPVQNWGEVEWLILKEVRIPRILVAYFSGMGLAVAGMLLQVFFRNPLAGPFVLGIHSGAGLGVSLFLLGGSFFSVTRPLFFSLGIPISSVLGSLLVIFFLLFISFKFEGSGILLVVGLLISYLCGGLVNILMSAGAPIEVKQFLVWGFGSFDKLSLGGAFLFSSTLFLFAIFPLLFARDLDQLALGEREAAAVGVNVKRLKIYIVVCSSILSGVVTAFCGPIVFIGMIAPHIARLYGKKAFHQYQIILTAMLGGLFALFGQWVTVFLFDMTIPINSILGIFGIPIIILFIVKSKRGGNL